MRTSGLGGRLSSLLALCLAAAALASCDFAPETQAGAPEQQARAENAAAAIPTPTFVPVAGVQPPRFETGGDPPAVPPASGTGAPASGVNAPAAGGETTQPAVDQVPPPAPQPTLPSVVAGAESVRLDDDAWYGGWQQSKTYGGRSATWIYGTGTEFSTMEAAFELSGQPWGEASLAVEGMDGENAPKMEISILVNGENIYTGPNRLPDDDHDLATGTWATYTWPFDAARLQPGVNTITIVALSPGSVGQPPFFMLDYADLAIGG